MSHLTDVWLYIVNVVVQFYPCFNLESDKLCRNNFGHNAIEH